MTDATRTITRLQDADDIVGTPAAGKGWLRDSNGAMAWTALASAAALDDVTATVEAQIDAMESVSIRDYNSGILTDPQTFHDAATDAMTRGKRLAIYGDVVADAFDPIYGGLVIDAPYGATLKSPAGSWDPVIYHPTGSGPRIQKIIFRGVRIEGRGYDAKSTIEAIVTAWDGTSMQIRVETGDGAAFRLAPASSTGQIRVVPASFGSSTPPKSRTLDFNAFMVAPPSGDVLTVDTDLTAHVGDIVTQSGRKRGVSLANADIVIFGEGCSFANVYNAPLHLIDVSRYCVCDGWTMEDSTTVGGLNAIHIGHSPGSSGMDTWGQDTNGFIGAGTMLRMEQSGIVVTGSGSHTDDPGIDETNKIELVAGPGIVIDEVGNWTACYVEGPGLRDLVKFQGIIARRIGWASGDGVAFGSAASPPTDTNPAGTVTVPPGGVLQVGSADKYLRSGTLTRTRSDGSVDYFKYSAHDANHFTLVDGGSFVASDLLQQYDSFLRRVDWDSCTCDCEDAVGMDGIHLAGDDVRVTNFNGRVSGDGVHASASSDGKRSERLVMDNVTIRLACTDPALAPNYLTASDQTRMRIRKFYGSRETDATLAAAAPGIVLARCDRFTLEAYIEQAGSHAVELNECVDFDIYGRMDDYGAQGNVDSAAAYLMRGCYDYRIVLAKGRKTTAGLRMLYRTWAAAGGAQRGKLDRLDFPDGILDRDDQDTTRVVSGLQVVADGGSLLVTSSVGPLSTVPAHGGRFYALGGVFAYTDTGTNLLKGVSPGATFPDGTVLSFVGGSFEDTSDVDVASQLLLIGA